MITYAKSFQTPGSLTKDLEVEATAMLLGEFTVICSCCLGRKWQTSFILGQRRCGQCKGTGYDYLGPKTTAALANKAR